MSTPVPNTEFPCARVERSLQKTYCKRIWNPFTKALKQYELLAPGDQAAVCVSGGKDSFLLAKLMQMLQRHSDFSFSLRFLCMDPGYSAVHRACIEANAARLEIPLEVFESDIFAAVEQVGGSPCYLCARMRRGHLYKEAQARGCNKIALGHHFNDVVETTLMGMLYGAQIQAMPPKLKSKNYCGMQLIRPLYCVHEEDILAWQRLHGLEFLRCACRFTEQNAKSADRIGASKRQEMKQLLRHLKQAHPDVEKCIFQSIHNVRLDTLVQYTHHGVEHSFLEEF
ncbi:MAG: tRNA 2-thiocytidine biosynthesis protein TtcA [Oscillospiraceae bacterium]|jgi:tRNA(Ile)-lysidine synthase TilS/MesJ|nr:tRNA 2-thiocytidine biosynthesis protein TtcA [Oscillospiraceae bacterium]